ncbi:MAG: transglycosylase domain-containing protein [Cyanobacteria bacterium J06634_6]
MTSPPPDPNKRSNSSKKNQSTPKTFLGSITQAFHTVQANVDFAKIPLKPNARVPKLQIEPAPGKSEEYPLVGEHYLLGRSSKACDIVVRSPIVSQTHLSLTRDRNRPGNPFVMKDQGSTNGIYRKKKRLSKFPLRHGDVLTLGPEELADAVTVRYIDPPPWYVQAVRYGLYGISGFTGLLVFWIVALEWPKFSINPLPESVQGPVLVTAEEGGDRVPLNELPNITHRENKSLQEYSEYLPQALVASEDTRFYWHPGVDPWGIARALKTNVQQGSIREGASTLTQQLARNTFRDYVGTEDSAERKIREAIVALKIETFYSKDAIMLLYLNRVYLGNNLYGFEDASQFYFGKSASELEIEEAATLVGILPAPNAFNPVQDYDAAIDYRDRVIERMVGTGAISAEEGRRARRSRIEISPKAREQLKSTRAPYFYSYVLDELYQVLGSNLASEGNFIVETSIDFEAQAAAENALIRSVNNDGAALGYSQGAVVTMNTQNGEIEALVGGVDYARSQFNRASQAVRQPGSTFKVFAYASAIEQGISPNRVYSCDEINWDGFYLPACADGSLDMYAGLARSRNPIALRVAQDAGLDSIVELANRLGIESELNPVPGLVLGQSEVTPLEITGAFAALANEGVWNRPHGIQRVIDSSDCEDFEDLATCRVIYDFEENSGDANQQVVDPYVANTMVSIMQGTVQPGGTGTSAYLGLGEAGKTGTTNDNVDRWFIGFVPRNAVVTGVWLGNDDNTPGDGSSAQAAALWGNYMGQIVR